MLLFFNSSKTQSFTGPTLKKHSQPSLLDKTQRLLELLRAMPLAQFRDMLGTSEKLALQSWQQYQDLHLPLTPDNAKQALTAFSGDAYRAIDVDSYDEAILDFAQKHLLIGSGLFGVLRPLDLIPPYRLEMAARLRPAGCSNLYQFWSEDTTRVIRETLAGHRDQRVISLASTEYSRIIDRKKLGAQIIDITFRQMGPKGWRTVPIHSKRARGLMVHTCLLQRWEQAEQLREFREDGYRFSEDFSTAANWVFCQKA